MKKTVFALMLLLAWGCVAFADVKVEDIDKKHWAYDKIQRLVKDGYLALYDDNTFRPDQSVSRVAFAAALGKLIDQIERGEVKMLGLDMKALKKLSDEFKTEMADYDTRVAALEKRLSDIESTKVVTSQDISKVTLGVQEVKDENTKLRDDLGIVTDQMKVLTEKLDKSEKSRKKAQTFLAIGVVAAIAVGLASN